MKTESILKELTDMTNRIEEFKKQIEKPENKTQIIETLSSI